ncbi:MAG: Gfo/Idh/MocA family oxidoreductase [Theionarchaea archaeon]|nr:Gfo/Idh/MocA family oxidoreductase [Theionarchaea archaeon]
MRKIKAGIIGTGFIGPAHVEAVRRLGFVEMKAVAEADQDLAREKADQLHIPNAFGDYKKILDDPEIEVVHNCTPNFLHYKINQEIMEAGKNIISEKPLAMNSEESSNLVKKAANTGMVNGIDFNYRHYPLVQQARAMIERGDLGEIYSLRGSYLQDWLFLETDYNWRLEPEVGGDSRAVGDVGSHWCDTAQFVTGLNISKVCADLRTIMPMRKKPKRPIETYLGKELGPEDYDEKPIKTEDYAGVLFEMDSGARGLFGISQMTAGRKNRLYIEVDGSKAALAWDQEKPNEMWIGRREKANELLVKDPSLLFPEVKKYAHYPGGHPEAYPDGIKMFVRNFYEFVAEDKNPKTEEPDFPTFEDGHHEVVIVDAILESDRERKWVDIEM